MLKVDRNSSKLRQLLQHILTSNKHVHSKQKKQQSEQRARGTESSQDVIKDYTVLMSLLFSTSPAPSGVQEGVYSRERVLAASFRH